MKRLLAVFVLTPREQRLVIFVMLALVLGASITNYVDMKVNDEAGRSSDTLLMPLVSPTPNE